MERKKDYSCIKKNKVVFQKTIGLDLNIQECIEEYLEDLFKIIKCDCHSFVMSIDIYNSLATVMGKSEICLTYQTEKGNIVYTDFVEEFEKKIDIGEVTEYAFGVADSMDKYCSFRVINNRKIDFHISLDIYAKVFDVVSYPCISHCEKAMLLTKKKKITNTVNYNINKIDFDEEFVIGDNSQVNSIVCFNSFVVIKELKAINDKILVKAKCCVDILYTNSNNLLEKSTNSFDISKIIDIPGITENSKVFCTIKNGSLFLKQKNNSDKFSNIIQFYGEFYSYISVLEDVEQTIITDGYLKDTKCTCSYERTDWHTNCDLTETRDRCSFDLDLSESFNKIEMLSVTITPQYNSNNRLKAAVYINITTSNSESMLESQIFTKDIELDLKDGTVVNFDIGVDNFDYSIISDKTIKVNINYKLRYLVGQHKTLNILSDIVPVNEKINSPAITLYFAKKNEELWNIAKKFASDVELIKIENNITLDKLDSNKVIIIPGL